MLVSTDGGRVKVKVPHTRGRRKKNGRRGFITEWREPKGIIIQVLDDQGRPDRTVWAIDGDGCFQMTSQELITAAVEKIPVKIAILNNSYLGMVRQWQEMFYDERYSEVHQSPDLPDYVKLSEAMGCAAKRVEDPDEADAAIEWANEINDKPVVLEFRTEWTEKVFPMVPAGGSNSDVQVHPSLLDGPSSTVHPTQTQGGAR